MTGSSSSVTVEQGPRWLVELIFGPPAWFEVGFWVVCLSMLALAVWGLHRRGWRIDAETERAMLENGLTLVSIMATTLALSFQLNVSYLSSVVGGVVGGLAVAAVVERVASGERVADALDEYDMTAREDRRVAAWFGLGIAAPVITQSLAGAGTTPLVTNGGFLMFAAGMTMVGYHFATVEMNGTLSD